MRFEPLVTHSVAVLVAALVTSACGGKTSDPRAMDDPGADEAVDDDSDAGERDELEPGATDDEARDSADEVPGDERDPTSGAPSSDDPSSDDLGDLEGQPPLEDMTPRPLSLELDGNPEFSSFLRLTHAQWEASVSDLLNVDTRGLSDDFQQDPRLLFSNDERVLTVASDLYFDYEGATQALVASLDGAGLAAINEGDDAAGFITTFGRRAYRRPLTDDERARYLALYEVGASLNETDPFVSGAGLVIEAMLQSPFFLYRAELSPPGPLNGYEVATRLSYLLLGTTPSDALLDLAAEGSLDTADGVVNAAADIMQDPELEARTIEAVGTYHAESLGLARLIHVQDSRTDVAEPAASFGSDLHTAATLFFDRIYADEQGVREIFRSTTGYVNDTLAPLYGIDAAGSEFEAVDLGPERPGFLTQVPFLLLHGAGENPATARRGAFINSDVLCAGIPGAPLTPDFELPLFEPQQTNRDWVEVTTGEGTCGGACHIDYLNPLGFAFENFDGRGRLRDVDNGTPVDTRSRYPFTEGYLDFDGAPDLTSLIAEGEQAHTCYSARFVQHALGRELTEDDRSLIEDLSDHSLGGASIQELILEFVRSDTFRSTASGQGDQ